MSAQEIDAAIDQAGTARDEVAALLVRHDTGHGCGPRGCEVRRVLGNALLDLDDAVHDLSDERKDLGRAAA